MEQIKLGSIIEKYKLSDDIITDMLHISDNCNKSVTHMLAGRIEKEVEFPIDSLHSEVLDNFKNYFDEVFKSRLQNGTLTVNAAWVNFQIENEYNPLHRHDNPYHQSFQLTSVIFLEVPNIINNNKFPDGYLQFSNGNSNTMEKNDHYVLPEVGDFYIFPSTLNHIVYPFNGKGIRKSISINVSSEYDS